MKTEDQKAAQLQEYQTALEEIIRVFLGRIAKDNSQLSADDIHNLKQQIVTHFCKEWMTAIGYGVSRFTHTAVAKELSKFMKIDEQGQIEFDLVPMREMAADYANTPGTWDLGNTPQHIAYYLAQMDRSIPVPNTYTPTFESAFYNAVAQRCGLTINEADPDATAKELEIFINELMRCRYETVHDMCQRYFSSKGNEQFYTSLFDTFKRPKKESSAQSPVKNGPLSPVTEHDPMLQKALDAEITKRVAETTPLLNSIDNILSAPQFEYQKENMSKLIDLAHLSTRLMEAQGEQLALQLRICGLRKELQEANPHPNTQAAVRDAEQQRALDRINDRQKQIDSSPLNQ